MTYEPPTQPYNVPPQGPSGVPMAPAGPSPEAPKKKNNVVAIVGVAVAVVAAVGLGYYYYTQQVERDDTGNITDGGNLGVTELRVGDCLPSLEGEGEISSVDAVPCSEPHSAEVFHNFTATGFASYPGEDALFDLADEKCVEAIEQYAPVAWEEDPDLLYTSLVPTSGSWASGDRGITCVAVFPERTGSIKE